MKVNQLKAGAILSYLSMILGYIISIIYTPIMLRLLGQSEYGLYSLASSIVSYLGLLSFGFGSAYIRFYSRYKIDDNQEDIARLNGMFIVIFTFVSVIAILAGLVLVANVELMFKSSLTAEEIQKAKVLVAILVFNIAVSFPTSLFNSFITANEQYLFQRSIRIIRTVVNPCVMLPMLLLGFGSVGMVVITTLFNLVVDVFNIYYCIRKLNMKILFRKFEFFLFKEVAVFSFYIFLNMIVDQINWSVDKFLLGIFKGTAAVAVYGLAAQLNTYYVSLSTVISSVFIPKVNRIVACTNDNQVLTDLFTRIGRLQFILLSFICTGLTIFGKHFINLWAGQNYESSYMIALILIIPVTIPLTQTLGIEIQKAKNMHKFRSVVYICIAVTNILISIPLCQRLNGVGNAIGTAFSLLVGNGLIMNWYYHKKVKLDMLYYWKNIATILPALLPPIAVGGAMLIFIDLYRVELFLVCGAIFTVVYCLSMWFFGMNQYEKDLISKPAMNITKKLCKLQNKLPEKQVKI